MALIDQIYEDIKEEIEQADGDKFNPTLLKAKVKSAYRDVKAARKYPVSYSEATIDRDMENYYSQIRSIALYDFNQVGSEGQNQYSQDGVSIHYVDRDRLFYGVLPIAARG